MTYRYILGWTCKTFALDWAFLQDWYFWCDLNSFHFNVSVSFLYCMKFLSELFAITIHQQIKILWIQFLLLIDFRITSYVTYVNDCLHWYVSSVSVISLMTYYVPHRFAILKTRVEIKLGGRKLLQTMGDLVFV